MNIVGTQLTPTMRTVQTTALTYKPQFAYIWGNLFLVSITRKIGRPWLLTKTVL